MFYRKTTRFSKKSNFQLWDVQSHIAHKMEILVSVRTIRTNELVNGSADATLGVVSFWRKDALVGDTLKQKLLIGTLYGMYPKRLQFTIYGQSAVNIYPN